MIRVRSGVQLLPDPPDVRGSNGAIAQLGEHLLCKQGVVGSIPSSSTNNSVLIQHQSATLMLFARAAQSVAKVKQKHSNSCAHAYGL